MNGPQRNKYRRRNEIDLLDNELEIDGSFDDNDGDENNNDNDNEEEAIEQQEETLANSIVGDKDNNDGASSNLKNDNDDDDNDNHNSGNTTSNSNTSNNHNAGTNVNNRLINEHHQPTTRRPQDYHSSSLSAHNKGSRNKRQQQLQALSSISSPVDDIPNSFRRKHLTSIHEDEYEETLHDDAAEQDLDHYYNEHIDFQFPRVKQQSLFNKVMSKFSVPRVFGRKDNMAVSNPQQHYYDKAFMVDDDDDDPNHHEYSDHPTAPTGVEAMEQGHGENDFAPVEGVVLVEPDILHIRDRGLRRAKRTKRTICCIACMGITLLVTAIVVNQYQNNNLSLDTIKNVFHKNPQNDGTPAVSAHKQKMDLLCSAEMIQTTQGRQACEDACAVASCCHTSDVEDNCYTQYKLFCSEFTSCNLLKDGSPDIPTDEGGSSDTSNNTSSSATFTSSLPPSGILPPPDDELIMNVCDAEHIKSPVQQTIGQCEDLCEVAKCCFPSFAKLNPDMNCYDDINMETCLKYELCENIYHEPVGGVIGNDIMNMYDDQDDSSTSNTDTTTSTTTTKDNSSSKNSPVYEACDPSKILVDEEAEQICVELCESFQCCFVELPKVGFCKDDPGCTSGWGAPCEILYNPNYTSNTDSDNGDVVDNEVLQDIQRTCGHDGELSTDLKDMCEDLCAPAMCCFIEDPFHGGCSSESWCNKYSACSILVSSEGGADDSTDVTTSSPISNAIIHTDETGTVYVNGIALNDVQDMIYQLCEDDDVDLLNNEADKLDCQEACEPSECCYLEPDSDRYCGTNMQLCNAYEGCYELHQGDLSNLTPLDKSNSNTDPTGNIEWHTDRIKEVCEDNYNQADCLEVCLPGECCYMPSSKENAQSSNDCPSDFNCDPFWDCDVLLGPSTAFGQGLSTIQQVVTSVEEQDDTDFELLIGQTCSGDLKSDKTKQHECLAVCEVAKCCFETCDTPPQVDRCAPYHQCQALIGVVDEYGTPPTEKQISDLTRDIDSKCDEHNLSESDLRLQCSTACQQARCCYEYPDDNDRNCIGQDWCEPYASCHNLLKASVGQGIPYDFTSADDADDDLVDNVVDPNVNNDIDTNDIEEAVVEACVKDVDLTQSQDRLECAKVCKVAKCCFEDYNDSCTGDEDWCQPYKKGCHLLLSTTVAMPDNTDNNNNNNGNNDDDNNDDNNDNSILDESAEEQLEEQIERTCQDISFVTARDDCLAICQPAKCCFTFDENSCDYLPSDGTSCDVYRQCEILVDGTPINYLTADDNNDNDKKDQMNGIELTGLIERKCGDGSDLGGDVDMSDLGNRKDCLDICLPGECCFNDDIPCDSSVEGCDPYDACEVLLGITDFAKGLKNELDLSSGNSKDNDGATMTAMQLTKAVEDLCEGLDGEEDDDETIEACQTICMEAQCCFSEEIQCPPTINGCDPYDSCEVLLDIPRLNYAVVAGSSQDELNDSEDDDGPIDKVRQSQKIADACDDMENTGHEGCYILCQEAECCFDPSLKCGANLVECDVYSDCEKLMDVVDDTFTYAGGRDDDEDDENDEDDDKEDSTKNGPPNLDGMHLTSQVERQCQDITFVTARDDCLEICQPAECCFNSDIPCSPDLVDEDCDPFEACQILIDATDFASSLGAEKKKDSSSNSGGIDDHDSDNVTLEMVQEACKDIATFQGEAACMHLCKPAECCFDDCSDGYKPAKAFISEDDPKCQTIYDPCQILIEEGTDFATHEDWNDEDLQEEDEEEDQDNENESDNNNNDNDSSQDIKITANMVEEACKDIASFKGRAKCLEMCEPSECCFEICGEAAQQEHSLPSGTTCDTFEACNVLVEESTEFANKNGNNNIDDEDEEQDNDNNNDFMKDEDDAATIVDGIRLTGKVEAFCLDPELKNDEVTRNKCYEICQPAECCFDNDIKCPKDLIGCDPYDSCEMILGITDFAGGDIIDEEDEEATTNKIVEEKDEGDGSTDIDPLILNVCSSSNLATKDGLNACREACGFRACCFAPIEDDNCYQDNVKWCQAYEPCEDPMKGLYEN